MTCNCYYLACELHYLGYLGTPISGTYLWRAKHGTEGEHSGTVFHCGLAVKRTLCVHQQNRHLHNITKNT